MATPPVPNRHAKQTRFLAGLAQGRTPAEAAALTDVPLPTFYTWRTKHTRFREAWNKSVLYARTPPFPSPAKLAEMSLTGPKSHWLWLPAGANWPDTGPRRPGDWCVVVLRYFNEPTDLVIYRIVQENGDWHEHSRATSDQPMPEGVMHPAFALPTLYRARLPPYPNGRNQVSQR